MTISPYGLAAQSVRRASDTFTSLKNDLTTYQLQLSSGKAATSYSALGASAPKSLQLTSQMSTLDGYSANIADAQLRVKLMSNGLQQIATLSGSLSTGLSTTLNQTVGQTNAQVSASDGLKQVIDILNTDVNGRYLFSGRSTDTEPVASYDQIMKGDPTTGQAGVEQVVAERNAADIGDGFGRLDIGVTSATVTLGEDAAASPFGFKIDNAGSSGGNIAVSTTPATPLTPATTTIDVNSIPAQGDKVSISLILPDGTGATVNLIAQLPGTNATSELGDGSVFYAIGTTRDETATNLANALRQIVGTTAGTKLAAASTVTATKDFFSDPPLRVDGADPKTATALKPGTSADTLQWYRGDTSGSPRDTNPVRLSDTRTIGIGMEANESALRAVFANYAALDVSTFPATDGTSQARYAALASRVSTNMSFTDGSQSVEDMVTDVASASLALDTGAARIKVTGNQLGDILDGLEGADPTEATTKLLSVQTRLQASYQVTSTIAKLSLVDYLS